MNVLRLKEVLKEKGISSLELSEKIKLSKTSISQILNENQQPRFETLLKIAMALDVDVRDLFNATKDNETETIYVLREGSYVSIGKINNKKK